MCGADGTESVSDRGWFCECDFFSFEFPGHKDEVICRWMAEKVSKELGKRVVCTGGFHKDGISEKEIREVQGSVVRLTEMVIEGLQR